MREIKFRAWEDNKMWYQVRCGGMFDGIPTAPTVWIEDQGWGNLTGQPHTKVMQYTGLTDKNGREIYEGDVVSIQKYIGGIFYPMNSGVVAFSDGSFFVKAESSSYYAWLDYEVEVLGNIYENPELLEGEQE